MAETGPGTLEDATEKQTEPLVETKKSKLIPWDEFELPPCSCSFKHSEDAKLHALPQELLEDILMKATEDDKYSLPFPAGKDTKATVFTPTFLSGMCTKLRLNKALSKKLLPMLLNSITKFRQYHRDGVKPEHRYGEAATDIRAFDPEEEVQGYSSLDLHVTLDSLATFKAIANNQALAALVDEIDFSAYDFDVKQSRKNEFAESLRYRWHVKGYRKWGLDEAETEVVNKKIDDEYDLYRRFVAEHQRILQDGTFKKVLAEALPKLLNAKALIFTRENTWGRVGIKRNKMDFDLHTPSKVTLKSSDIRRQHLEDLQKPVYWNGLFQFLSVATGSSINSVAFREMVPDLSLVPNEHLEAASPFLSTVEHIDIECATDSHGYQKERFVPREGTPRCRNAFKDGPDKEIAAWSRLLASSSVLETFQLRRGQVEYRNGSLTSSTTTTSQLLNLIVKSAAPTNFVKLRMDSLDLDPKVFQHFMQHNCQDVEQVYISGLRLISGNDSWSCKLRQHEWSDTEGEIAREELKNLPQLDAGILTMNYAAVRRIIGRDFEAFEWGAPMEFGKEKLYLLGEDEDVNDWWE